MSEDERLQASRDSAARQVVRAQFDANSIAGQDADEVLSEPAGDVAQHLVRLAFVLEFEPEHRVRQGLNNPRFDFNCF